MKNCKHCQSSFEITPSDERIYAKMNVPSPTLCPDCRQQRRIAFRNDSNFYKNNCSLCKKSLVSIYSPDPPAGLAGKNIPVLCSGCFWSDKWDPLSYGQDFDFNHSFFEQYAEMRAKVPRLAIFNTQSENSEFTVHSSKNHNCYMGSSIVNSEDTHYSDWAFNCRDCMDLLFCNRLEMCYQCFASQDCFHSNYLELCSNVTESFFAFDCRGSKRLVGCVSLRNRKNHILNQPASKEECFSVIKRLKTDRTFFLEFKKQFEALKAGMSKRDTWMINSENCTGDYIVNSKNAQFAFAVEDAEDARYLYESEKIKDAYDVTRVGQGEMLYEVTAGVDLKFAKFCNLTYHSDNMAYCDNCQNSSTCFGCVGLKNHQYCFLNKQYTKEEYVQLIPKVIEYMKSTGEYGEFFPFSFSPFGYNETKAQEFFPMTRDQVLARGWTWCDYELSASPALKQIPAQRIPDNISGVPDDILHWAVTCEVTGKPFKITPQELKFYRLKGLPIPHRCPRQRHLERTALQNPRHLYSRQCAKCQSAIQTTYAPDRPEKVLCGECYLSEVY